MLRLSKTFRPIFEIFWTVIIIAILIENAWTHDIFWTALFAAALLLQIADLVSIFAKGITVSVVNNHFGEKDKTS